MVVIRNGSRARKASVLTHWRKFANQRGDTLIEVVFALSILSGVLSSSMGIAIRASLLTRTAAERTALATEAQQQIEYVRGFRDNNAWATFLNGRTSPTVFNGVMNGQGSIPACRVDPTCLHMILGNSGPSESQYVPAAGSMSGSVPTSYLELAITPDNLSNPTYVDVVASYGFDPSGGGVLNTGHIKTRLTTIGQAAAAPAPPAPPTPPVVLGACTQRGPNLIANGNFATDLGPLAITDPAVMGFYTPLPNRGPNTFPDDQGLDGPAPQYKGWTGGISQITDNSKINDKWRLILPFPGDNTVSPAVPPTDISLYSNPNQTIFEPIGTDDTDHTYVGALWKETLTGLKPNTRYDFSGYFTNPLTPQWYIDVPNTVNALIEFDVNTTIIRPAEEITPNGSQWRPIHLQFVTDPGQTTADVAIKDYAGHFLGDDFMMSSMGVYKCLN